MQQARGVTRRHFTVYTTTYGYQTMYLVCALVLFDEGF
jgi:hypothetical protein